MGINGTLKRMDSMMIASNIRKLSRFELIYSCVARFVNSLKNDGYELPETMMHYTEKEDYNKMVYHMRNTEINDRFKLVLEDAKFLANSYRGNFDQSPDYLLLIRVLKEQSKTSEDGSLILKEKSDDTMDSQILQSPADPDATYRTKAGKSYQGYVANLTETIGENRSIISDYDYRENTYSDSKFMKDALEKCSREDSPITLIADGAYGGAENHEMATHKNVNLITTHFLGRKPDKILTDFEFSEDGKKVLKCANGQVPLSNKYNSSSEQCRIVTLNTAKKI